MSDFENPYQSSNTQIVSEENQTTGVEFTDKMLQLLYDASPWLRFIGIAGYVVTGIIVAAGILAAVGIFSNFPIDTASSGIGTFLIAFFLPIGSMFFFLSRYIYKFGQKIRSYRFTNSPDDLEQAFKNNKALWLFIGILVIIYLAFIPVSVIIGIIVGIASVLGGV